MYFLAVCLLICGVIAWQHVAIVAAWMTFWMGLSAALLVGAPLFWVLILGEILLLFWCLDGDEDEFGGYIATVSIVIVVLVLQFVSDARPFGYVRTHPWLSLASIAAYIVIGGLWSIGKWWFVETARYQKVKDDFLLEHRVNGTVIPTRISDKWLNRVVEAKSNPHSSQQRFLSWIAYWPWSMTWTLLNDPIKRMSRRIYYELQSVYQRITDHVWVVK